MNVKRKRRETYLFLHFLKHFLIGMAVLLTVSFCYSKVANAAILGYENEESCWRDIADIEAGLNPRLYDETHTDELTFHVDSNLDFYSDGETCFAANKSIRSIADLNTSVLSRK